MAKDDYFVIVYRLLKYLYDCLKKSKKLNRDVLTSDFFGIEEEYWEYILRNLLSDGYIEGVTVVPVMGIQGGALKVGSNFQITPKGILYLEENSMFQKVKGFVTDIATIVPF
jgi:hypothetical protein